MIWWILLAIAVVALLAHWGSKNAVWGTATLGFIVGLAIAIFRLEFDWWIVGKAVIVSTFLGVVLEWVPRLLGKRST